jgi:hypothetical protein
MIGKTRLGDRLPMPPKPTWNYAGTIVGYSEQSVEPIEEIDNEPGAYAGAEWRYAKRVLVQLARYDNRADPTSFAGGHWGWAPRSRTSACRRACLRRSA